MFSRYFELNQTYRRVWNSQNAELPRLTPWRYVFDVTQTLVNKQRYWMDLTLARSNGAHAGCGLNRFVNEVMNYFSNVKVHLKTRIGNVNI